MKVCFMCDLHLPFDGSALQYNILNWAIADIKKKEPDCIVYAGDVTCDGDINVYNEFILEMKAIGIPFFYIPGNSDLRNSESADEIKKMASECKNIVADGVVYALNDCDMKISDEQLLTIEDADENSIVFMHHPLETHEIKTREKLKAWREKHSGTMLFSGHRHHSLTEGNSVSLQAMDPDKAIGENPCITYFDTKTKEFNKAYYFSPVPGDLYGYFGVSCYDVERDIGFAIENKLKCLELRSYCFKSDKARLSELVEKWRNVCGENLSIHLPEISYKDGEVIPGVQLDELIDLAVLLKADRFTQHAPKVSVKIAKEDENVLNSICDYLAEKFNLIEHDVVIGIENMHMTKNDTPDDSRRFGYIPEECLMFMEMLGRKTKHKVGINFDIGHARNNVPYSQKYQISTWLSMLGKYIVGYHMHQVTVENGKFENHMPITHIYGNLISYSSFFRYWAEDRINKAPLIFEMRPEGAYETTLSTFNRYKEKNVFDIHSHTYYSWCGKDDPRELINVAIKNGISLFGICDHNIGIGKRKNEYIEKMRALAEEYKDRIKLVCGIEIATIDNRYDLTSPEEIKDFDYCLIEHITDSGSIVGGEIFDFCKKHKILCGIAHTDLFEYCDMYGYDYEDFFRKMAENNIFWEMNVNYDSIHHYREHQYVKDFMTDESKIALVKSSGVYVSIGFDGHRLEDYDGFRVYEMYDFLKENGIKTIDEILGRVSC